MDDNNTPHRAAAMQNLSSAGKKFFKYIEFDPDEVLVREIRKHPFGLFLIELAGFFLTAFVTVLIIFLAFMVDDLGLVENANTVATLQPILVFTALIIGLLGIAGTFLAGWVLNVMWLLFF